MKTGWLQSANMWYFFIYIFKWDVVFVLFLIYSGKCYAVGRAKKRKNDYIKVSPEALPAHHTWFCSFCIILSNLDASVWYFIQINDKLFITSMKIIYLFSGFPLFVWYLYWANCLPTVRRRTWYPWTSLWASNFHHHWRSNWLMIVNLLLI